MKKLLCIGHRGAAGHAPENTLSSIEKALALGADWIESDVYAVEGKLVVIHDDRLEHTTDGSGYVLEQTLEYLRSLNAGNGEQIPFLSEVFDLVSKRAGINIELKGPGTATPTAALIREYIRHHDWQYDQLLVSSFNHHELHTIKQLLPDIRIGALTASIPLNYAAFAEDLGAYSINVSLSFINQEFVDDAHRRNLKVYVYTVNHPEDLLRMKSLGVDGVFTDYPEIVTGISID